MRATWSAGSRGLTEARTEADGEACHGEQPEAFRARANTRLCIWTVPPPAASNTVSAAINVVHVPILNQAVLSHGAAATGSAVTALHDAVKFGLPVAAGVAWQRVRKSERYRDAKDDLSVLLDKAMTAL